MNKRYSTVKVLDKSKSLKQDIVEIEKKVSPFEKKRKKVVVLEVDNYCKKYKKSKTYSSNNITFSISTGEVVGLVGSNGAGKSTIIKAITGILPYKEGSIKICGYDLNKMPQKAKKNIGYVPDDHTVYDKLTGREYVNYMGSLYGASKLQKSIAINKLAKNLGIYKSLDVQIANYSHGMKQKICILGSLVHLPKIWILDEPMVGLDPQTMALLIKIIRRYADSGHAVLFSSHNLDTVQKTCDKVIFIKKGKLIQTINLHETDKDFDLDDYFMNLNEVKKHV